MNKPDPADLNSERLCALGLAYKAQSKIAEAIAMHQRAIDLKPNSPEAHYNLGTMFLETGDLAKAIVSYRNAIAYKPDFPAAYCNLGTAYKKQGQLNDAAASYRRAIALDPTYAAAYMNLGNTLKEQGNFEEAIDTYGEAARLNPDHPEVHYNVGVTLLKAEDSVSAINSLRRAITLRSDFAEAHCSLGEALKGQGQWQQAIISFERAIGCKPNYPEAYANLGATYMNAYRIAEAAAMYERAIALKNDYADAYCNLAAVQKEQGKVSEAIRNFRKAADLNPELWIAKSNLLFCLNYDDEVTAQEVAEVHRNFGRGIPKSKPSELRYNNPGSSARKLQIGYLSPDLRQHSVSYFIEPLLRYHNSSAVEVHCYADLIEQDAVSARLATYTRHWVIAGRLSDDALARRIREDQIDILVDLAGHTAKNRLRVFAAKPAPIQVSWLGYPNTTGLQSIDFRIVDAITDPIGESDRLCTEHLVRLEGGFLCYAPPKDAPEVAPPPFEKCGFVTFGSFNSPAKLSNSTLLTWARILEAVPGSRLTLKGMPFSDSDTRALYFNRFVECGIPVERVELVGWQSSNFEHLKHYDRIDVALDPFPYNGTTTTCEALWMGVPVVARRGDRHAGRVGASLLTQAGLADLIADSADSYVGIAKNLADDLERLKFLRRTLRPHLAASTLCNGESFARKMEAAYEDMWVTSCLHK